MSKEIIKLPNGDAIEARVSEETIVRYDAHAKVNGRSFYTYDHEDEEEALDDLRAQILQAFPEREGATPEEAEALRTKSALWMRRGESYAAALERWNKGEPLPTPPLKQQLISIQAMNRG